MTFILIPNRELPRKLVEMASSKKTALGIEAVIAGAEEEYVKRTYGLLRGNIHGLDQEEPYVLVFLEAHQHILGIVNNYEREAYYAVRSGANLLQTMLMSPHLLEAYTASGQDLLDPFLQVLQKDPDQEIGELYYSQILNYPKATNSKTWLKIYNTISEALGENNNFLETLPPEISFKIRNRSKQLYSALRDWRDEVLWQNIHILGEKYKECHIYIRDAEQKSAGLIPKSL